MKKYIVTLAEDEREALGELTSNYIGSISHEAVRRILKYVSEFLQQYRAPPCIFL